MQLTSVVRSSSISNDVSSAIKVVDRVQAAPFSALVDIAVSADVGQFFNLIMADSSNLQFLSYICGRPVCLTDPEASRYRIGWLAILVYQVVANTEVMR